MADFTKHDEDKPRPDLIDPNFLLGMARVMAHGAKKYGDENWRQCPDSMRYYAATLRHLLVWANGEFYDADSGEDHLYHAACSLMMLAELGKREMV
jgi:hypothetical protein